MHLFRSIALLFVFSLAACSIDSAGLTDSMGFETGDPLETASADETPRPRSHTSQRLIPLIDESSPRPIARGRTGSGRYSGPIPLIDEVLAEGRTGVSIRPIDHGFAYYGNSEIPPIDAFGVGPEVYSSISPIDAPRLGNRRYQVRPIDDAGEAATFGSNRLQIRPIDVSFANTDSTDRDIRPIDTVVNRHGTSPSIARIDAGPTLTETNISIRPIDDGSRRSTAATHRYRSHTPHITPIDTPSANERRSSPRRPAILPVDRPTRLDGLAPF